MCINVYICAHMNIFGILNLFKEVARHTGAGVD